MQPTPPKSKKPVYRRPFYDAGKKTSAEIVSEARTTMRVLETSRPFTPIEANRRLFGNSSRSSEGRPPSAFSIGPSTFSDPVVRSSSRPPTGRLSPLKQTPTALSSEVDPVNPGISKTSRSFSDSSSQEFSSTKISLPLKSEKEPFLAKESSSSHKQHFTERRVQSGPREHSKKGINDIGKNLRKSSSIGTLQKEMVAIDSGVGEDTFIQNRGLRSLSLNSNNSSENSLTESGVGLSNSDDRSLVSQEGQPTDDKTADSQSVYFKENIDPLLRQMELNYLHSDTDALSINFDVLWKNLEISGLLVKASGSGAARRRTTILRTLFKFVDVECPEVILKLCKLVLMMKVTGKNLVNICKIIFKISKDKTKDVLFKESDIISDILNIISSDISSLYEGIIYATGAIKFLALNKLLHDDLMKADCTACFTNLLKNIKSMTSEASMSIHLSHLIIQASAAIRNIADIANIRVHFVKSGLIALLLELLQTFWKDPDYILNLSRILSKLTQYSDCCAVVAVDEKCLELLLQAMKFHHKNQDVVVRVAFVLGNVAAKESNTRKELYFKHNSLYFLLAILNEYFEHVQSNDLASGDDGNCDEEIQKSVDVLIKVVRVVANMAIDRTVASDITNNNEFINIVINLLQNQRKRDDVEELFINTAAMLNNLSYYASEDSIFTSKTKELTEALLHLLFIDNMECITEVTRVFGNFTRFKEIRVLLRNRKVVQMLITLLESSEREVVFCACGALINLMVDIQNREILLHEKGIRKLIDALKDFGQTDWQLSSMICQTLWNYSEKITSSVSCFGEEETDDLIQILQDYTDLEVAFDYVSNPDFDPETIELMKQIWKEQFEPVGGKLLNRIQSYHTELEPLLESPD